MSYILEALKKSEQQRQHHGQSQPSVSGWLDGDSAKQASSLLPGLFVGMVMTLLISAIIAYWYLPESSQLSEGDDVVSFRAEANAEKPEYIDVMPARQSSGGDQSRAERQSVEHNHNVSGSVGEPQSAAQYPPVLKKRSEKILPDNKAEDVVSQRVQRSQRQLPPLNVLKKVPDLIITGHIYSSVADKRSVSMNGHDWREGDYIAPGLTLSEITPSGILVEIDGWSLPVKRNRGWQAID